MATSHTVKHLSRGEDFRQKRFMP